ncbi:hypothetical protein [Chryseobacterium hagamense]|uniref:Uncharacterized protein n=1 Tax=Chryseobacterium hagamense TaxID=395935 RepID=A0A511YQT8_9FLAO|nr:hypothetical protein [Chryseobacterium hagamense]GEN77567.1 hypothetical protein CHA01nite_33070 [Chryseobacterium hagamense]
MIESLSILSVLLGLPNIYFFLFFRRDRKHQRASVFFSAIFGLSILLEIIVAVKNSDFSIDSLFESIVFVFLISILIPGYFFMLFGINSLLEHITIVRGYFTYSVIFSVLTVSLSILYYFISVMILTLNYF